ncbi:hypothetical protein AKJ43_00655 [candidate division MSBL1 archaeon SCGC-AAA261D19]|uniref:Uncharacterized protein n=1 Tax=candidate division MSBL1 archaeon SCGC-AAA261D19 TaxID=1698273 RepID=A0A133V8J6_9EURY|nr:hypothetical protein AKJ43_00655 [candidate division MSBL1 archaeon SCGC-AAA261D19]
MISNSNSPIQISHPPIAFLVLGGGKPHPLPLSNQFLLLVLPRSREPYQNPTLLADELIEKRELPAQHNGLLDRDM